MEVLQWIGIVVLIIGGMGTLIGVVKMRLGSWPSERAT